MPGPRSRPVDQGIPPKHCTLPARRAEGLWWNQFPTTPWLGGGMETPMSEVTLYGFPRSVYVQMAGIVLTHHEVAYAFSDLETGMNTPAHLALHPFERVPILRHGDFTLYETVRSLVT